MSRLRENLSTGVWWGSRYAFAYVVVGTIIALARRDVLESYGLTLPGLIGAYVAGGIGGGALTGLLLPLVRGQFSAAVVGFLVALPVMLMFSVAMSPPDLWSSEGILSWVISAAFLGPLCGAGLWRVMQRD